MGNHGACQAYMYTFGELTSLSSVVTTQYCTGIMSSDVVKYVGILQLTLDLFEETREKKKKKSKERIIQEMAYPRPSSTPKTPILQVHTDP